MKSTMPRVTFRVSRLLNQFCHISVLYPEFLHSELSNGMLANIEYRGKNAQHRRPEITEKLESAREVSPRLWYSFSRAMMKADSLKDIQPLHGQDSSGVELFVSLIDQNMADYGEIWKDVGARLEQYTNNFAKKWSQLGDRVLSNLSNLVQRDWDSEEIVVCFVDCMYGGFGWVDSIALTPVPEMDVAKKLLTHELSELITPQNIVAESLRRAGLEDDSTYQHGLVHTVVDLVAYFSVKEFLSNPERKGMKPNPKYYPYTDAIYPLFEAYSSDPTRYENFEELIREMVSVMKERGPRVAISP